MSRLSVLRKTHSYISLTTILLKNLANTYMLFMEDGSWVSLISKPPSRTNNSSFSKTSNLKSFPKPFPSSHTFGLRDHFLDSPLPPDLCGMCLWELLLSSCLCSEIHPRLYGLSSYATQPCGSVTNVRLQSSWFPFDVCGFNFNSVGNFNIFKLKSVLLASPGIPPSLVLECRG